MENTVNIPLTLIWSALGLLVSAIGALATYIVGLHKSSNRQAKENLETMTRALIGNSTALERHNETVKETNGLIHSLNVNILTMQNGNKRK